MSVNYPDGSERETEIVGLRGAACSAALKLMADIFDGRRRLTVSDLQEPFDEACKALADKLREPEKCYACGQEKTCESA